MAIVRYGIKSDHPTVFIEDVFTYDGISFEADDNFINISISENKSLTIDRSQMIFLIKKLYALLEAINNEVS